MMHQTNSLFKSCLVWGLACMFYFYEFLLQVSPSVMSTELMHDFNVTGHSLGILAGIYFYSYAAMQLPCGVLMDSFGPRRLLTIATTICAMSTIAFGMTDHFLTACIARLMIGFGSAFAAVGAMKLALNWFPAERFALLTGMMVTIGMLGAIGGEAPLALLIDECGWRPSMLILGGMGIGLALLIFFIVSDYPTPRTQPEKNKTATASVTSVRKSLINLIKNRQLWLIATYGGLMYMTTPVFCGLWGVPFLMLKLHLTKATAANYISFVFIGWALAGPFWGIYSNQIGLRKPPLYIGCVGALISSCLVLFAPIRSHGLTEFLLFMLGVFSAGFLPAFAVAKELCNQRYAATGLSFMNMMNMIGVAVMQPLVGFVLDLLWQGQIINKVRAYPLVAYYAGLGLLPLGMLAALLILPHVRETYCRNIHEN